MGAGGQSEAASQGACRTRGCEQRMLGKQRERWEIAIKVMLGKYELGEPLDRLGEAIDEADSGRST